MSISRRRIRPSVAVLLVAVLPVGLAACGGSSGTNSTGSTATTTPSTSTTPATTANSTTTPTATGSTSVPLALHVTMTASGHAPVANKAWHYAVRVTDSAGKLVSATVHAQVLYQGVVVGQIDNGAVHNAPHGVWTEAVTWPTTSVGQQLVLQVVVTALGTTAKVNYPILVAAA